MECESVGFIHLSLLRFILRPFRRFLQLDQHGIFPPLAQPNSRFSIHLSTVFLPWGPRASPHVAVPPTFAGRGKSWREVSDTPRQFCPSRNRNLVSPFTYQQFSFHGVRPRASPIGDAPFVCVGDYKAKATPLEIAFCSQSKIKRGRSQSAAPIGNLNRVAVLLNQVSRRVSTTVCRPSFQHLAS